MRQVDIDNSKGLVVVDSKPVPRLLLGLLRGAVGRCFVVKRYRGKKKGRKVVVTRYPDMNRIVVSEQQRKRRDLFREAVVYAQWILSEPERKKAFRKTLSRKKQKHVYQAAIQLYLGKANDQEWLSKQLAVRGMMSSVRREKVDADEKWAICNRQWAKREVNEEGDSVKKRKINITWSSG